MKWFRKIFLPSGYSTGSEPVEGADPSHVDPPRKWATNVAGTVTPYPPAGDELLVRLHTRIEELEDALRPFAKHTTPTMTAAKHIVVNKNSAGNLLLQSDFARANRAMTL